MAESAVFLNSLKFENKKPKEFTNNHRDNYAKMNKSSIFDEIPNQSEPRLNKKPSVPTFVPKYENISANERKLKEFVHPKASLKDIKQEITPVEKPQKTENLNARERKLKENHPNLDLQEHYKTSNDTPNNDLSQGTSKSINSTPKLTRMRQNFSTIFNHNNTHLERIVEENLENEKKEKLEQKKKNELDNQKKPVQKTKTAANFDWKSTNSQLIFGENEKYSNNPKQTRLNSYRSFMDPEHLMNMPPQAIQTEENEKIQKELLSKEEFKKVKQTLSTLHGADFYNNSQKSQTQDKKVDTYEIKNVDYEGFNIKDFKNYYNSNGIHIYDVNMNPEKFSKGVLMFKVRNNCDEDGFSQKIKEVNEKIMTDLHINLNKVEKSTVKPKPKETLEKSLSNSEFQKIKLNPSEKFSSNKIFFDQSYKNKYSKKYMYNSKGPKTDSKVDDSKTQN